MSTSSDAKAAFIAASSTETYKSGWSSVERLSPALFKASTNILAVPKQKKHLPPRIQSLIALSVDCASTHLYQPGIRTHMNNALDAGASIAEVVEVIELTSTLGIHACNIGVPLLVDVMKEMHIYTTHATASKPLDARREALKADFTAKRGYWHTFWEDFLKLDPEFFEAYLEFSTVPWVKEVNGKAGGALEPKVKELVYCAFDAAATHLYVPGLRLHMKNALGYGASPEEIVEVLEIATGLSLHTAAVACPILEEVVRARQS